MGKNARDRAKGRAQSFMLNAATEQRYINDIVKVAQNRFRWVGLPESVNVRFLEMTLLQHGMATIAKPKDLDNVWYGLQVGGINGSLNAYGDPTEWQAIGVNADTIFNVDNSNGVLVYGSNLNYGACGSSDSTWIAIQLFARKLAHYDRTEDVNLQMQQAAFAITCEQQKRNEAVNLFKQISGFEPAVFTTPNVQSEIGVGVIKTDVPFIGDALNSAKRNVWNAVYEYFGIPHLSFEKGERMIEQEAEGNNAPTNIRLLDALEPRRKAARQLSELLGSEVNVYYNTDLESRNYNYINSIEKENSDGTKTGE